MTDFHPHDANAPQLWRIYNEHNELQPCVTRANTSYRSGWLDFYSYCVALEEEQSDFETFKDRLRRSGYYASCWGPLA